MDVPFQPVAHRQNLFERLTEIAPNLAIVTAGMFASTAVAEFIRYGILLFNRTRLVAPIALHASDATVIAFAVVAFGVGIVTAIGCAGRLVNARREVFTTVGRSDPRRPWAVLLGCLLPGWNLIMPGVLLVEMARVVPDDSVRTRISSVVRIWWAAWVFGGVVAVIALMWRTSDSLQAKADGVLFTGFVDLVAAAVALATLWVIRTLERRDIFGRARSPRRLLQALGPAEHVIEPIRPGGSAMESAAR